MEKNSPANVPKDEHRYATGITVVVLVAILILFSAPLSAKARLMFLAADIAHEHGINIDHFFKVINCESMWNPNVQSGYVMPDGTYEDSWGIAQFNLATNDMTKEEALDPEFSLRKMAEYWSAGRMSGWKCYGLWEARNWK